MGSGYRGSAYAVVEVPPLRPAPVSRTAPVARTGSAAVNSTRPVVPSIPREPTGDPAADAIREYQIRLLADTQFAADRMLAAAEEQAARIVRDARQQADQAMRSAQFHSKRMIGNAKIESALAGRRVAELRTLERKLRESIKSILGGGTPSEEQLDPAPDLGALAGPTTREQPTAPR